MTIKVAFVGFRHGHILDLYRRVQESEDFEVVAACEEDEIARAALPDDGSVTITHSNFGDMVTGVDCDAVAVGDYYSKRGELIIRALDEGKHVIADKPICTDLTELDEIKRLARDKNRVVGCMLDLRDAPQVIALRSLVRSGQLGDVQAIHFGGQHPLLLGTRPGWYFEPGKHGGTINDIAIHAFDVIPWVTGESFATIEAARSWNAFVPQYPHFRDAGQMMLTMGNGCGVMGDVSYFMPNGIGYKSPLYWRMTFWGSKGVVEISYTMNSLRVAQSDDNEMRSEPLPAGDPGGYLRAFLHEVIGQSVENELSTADVIRSARVALKTQNAADQELRGIPL